MDYFNELFANMIPLLPLATYIPVVQSYNKKSRFKFAILIVIISFIILSLIFISGERVMNVLQIRHNSISLAGGLILLITGIQLIFEKPDSDLKKVKLLKQIKAETKNPTSEEHSEPIKQVPINPLNKRDVSIGEMLSWAIVPINFPLIIGPGVMAWALKMSTQTSYLKVAPSIIANLFIQFITLLIGNLVCQLKNSSMYAAILKKILGFLVACVGSKYIINVMKD
jgi:small neutral amino acid transporter SnatA (MarC family)